MSIFDSYFTVDNSRFDVNSDGKVSLTDIIIVKRAIINQNYSEELDINGDGKLSLLDVMLIKKVTISGSANIH